MIEATRHPGAVAAALASAIAIAGCGSDEPAAPAQAPTTTTTTSPTRSDATPAPEASPNGASDDSVEGSVVRFSRGGIDVDVTISSDNPTSREFLSLLPTTLTLEEFAGREKVSYLPDRLETEGSPGSDPEDGDLIYFVPWGNLGFYYNASGIGFSEDTINLGTYNASPERLAQLEGGPVRVRVIRRVGS